MDDIENPFIDKSIKQAKILRMLVLKMNERDKDIKDKRDEAEAELQVKKDSTDYPAEVIDTFFKEADYQEKVVADWEPKDENEEILFICDRLIYKLMAYDNDKWFPEADYEERTQLKLKEIVKITMK